MLLIHRIQKVADARTAFKKEPTIGNKKKLVYHKTKLAEECEGWTSKAFSNAWDCAKYLSERELNNGSPA